ncbi:hypothetical protein BRADI_4g32759v3 [Brachypodium distachyon]|uniref:Uncharacterized protein n=1 Tax=Brachypodium distachyon TaxID=15368 RepID=A0A0Q3HAY6_BRADI|nr:hypothetical protein BRADI_4g32759v3 [Brachypodium distachyon]
MAPHLGRLPRIRVSFPRRRRIIFMAPHLGRLPRIRVSFPRRRRIISMAHAIAHAVGPVCPPVKSPRLRRNLRLHEPPLPRSYFSFWSGRFEVPSPAAVSRGLSSEAPSPPRPHQTQKFLDQLSRASSPPGRTGGRCCGRGPCSGEHGERDHAQPAGGHEPGRHERQRRRRRPPLLDDSNDSQIQALLKQMMDQAALTMATLIFCWQ